MSAHGFHLRVEIVEVVQHQRFRKHRKLGRAEVVLSVMTNNQMLKQRLDLVRKSRDESNLRMQHLQFDDHMSEQLAARGIGKRAVISEFVDLSHVVKERAAEQQVAIDLRIVAAHQIAAAKERNNVIEQSSDVGVMQRLGGRSVAIGGGDLRISHENLNH